MTAKSDAELFMEEQERQWALSQPRNPIERARLPGWTAWAELRYQDALASTPFYSAREAASRTVPPIVSVEEVLRKRDELIRDERHHGHKSLAKACGVSPSTIRRRLAEAERHPDTR